MGIGSILGGIVSGVTGFARNVLGLGTRAVGTTATAAGRTFGTAGRFIAPTAVGLGAGYVGQQLAEGDSLIPGGTELAAIGGGNGREVTVTTVTTIDRATGQAIRQKVLQGSPYLMNRDMVVAKRVMRLSGKLGRKFSRKTREPSKQKMLMDAMMDKALAKAIGVNGCN